MRWYDVHSSICLSGVGTSCLVVLLLVIHVHDLSIYHWTKYDGKIYA